MDKEELIDLTSKIDKYSCPHIINFHCHTNFSDGSMCPEDLLDQAFRNKLQFLSITDHHSILIIIQYWLINIYLITVY